MLHLYSVTFNFQLCKYFHICPLLLPNRPPCLKCVCNCTQCFFFLIKKMHQIPKKQHVLPQLEPFFLATFLLRVQFILFFVLFQCLSMVCGKAAVDPLVRNTCFQILNVFVFLPLQLMKLPSTHSFHTFQLNMLCSRSKHAA